MRAKMNKDDIYIQFAKELAGTGLLDKFDLELGIAVMRLPISTKQANLAVKHACEWFVSSEVLTKQFFDEVAKHKKLSDVPVVVMVRTINPAELCSGCSDVDLSIEDSATVGVLSVALASHTVIDVFVIVEQLLRIFDPAVAESLVYG